MGTFGQQSVSDGPALNETGCSLLVESCRHDGATAIGHRRLAELDRASFRTSFLEQARRHGVLGLTLVLIERSNAFQRLADAAREQLLGALKLRRRRAALWLLERDRILSLLAQSDLRPVVLKGAALCTTAYREPAEREFIDIDLLIGRKHVSSALEILAASGYAFGMSAKARENYLVHHFHLPLRNPQGFHTELHWGLTRPSSPFYLDPASVMERSVTVEGRDGVQVRMPRPEDLLLHVVVQNIQEGFSRLSRLVDVDRIVRFWPHLSWAELRAQAARGGLDHALAVSLQLSRSLLGTPVPAETLECIRPPPLIRFHLNLLRLETSLRRGSQPRGWAKAQLLKLWLLSCRRSRLRLLWEVMRGSPDPMSWIWAPEASRTENGSIAAGLSGLAKLVGVQALLYSSTLASFVTCKRTGDQRMWQVQRAP